MIWWCRSDPNTVLSYICVRMKLFQMKLPEKDGDVDVGVVPADVVAVLDVSAIIQEWKKQLQWLQDYQYLNNQLAQRFHSYHAHLAHERSAVRIPAELA